MKYIDAEKLKALVKRQIHWENLNFAALGGGGQTFCINTLEWILKQIDSLQQEHPDDKTKYTKRNELFDQCVEKCDPKVTQEVSDNVDKLKSISTPAEEDWFKISEEWEKEDKQPVTDCNELEEAVEKQIDEALYKWSYDDEDGIEQYVHDAFIAGAEWAMNHKEDKQ